MGYSEQSQGGLIHTLSRTGFRFALRRSTRRGIGAGATEGTAALRCAD